MKVFNIDINKSILSLIIVFGLATVSSETYANNSNTPCDSALCGEFVKNFDATYTLNDNGAVFLINKHGKIKVTPSSENKVVIKVRVTANTNSQSNADKIFGRININFSNSDTYVKAETVISELKGGWFFGQDNNQDFTIDYDVSMPKNCNADITNKYGDTNIGALNNYVKIEQHYGNFKLEAAKYANISLAYGEGTLNDVGGMTGNISYAHLNIPNFMKDIQLKSKYSELHISKSKNVMIESAYDQYILDDTKNITINSRYGDFEIGEVNDIRVNSSYTDFKIKSLVKDGNFSTNYGDVHISNVESEFSTIDIISNYTGYVIDIVQNSNFQGEISGNYSDVNLPRTFVKKLHDVHGSHETIAGYNGTEKGKGVIKAKLNYGGLVVK